jgi:hypothetical protein
MAESANMPVPPSGLPLSAADKEVIIRSGLSSGTRVVAGILGSAVGIGLLFIFFAPRPEAIPRNALPFLISVAGVLAGWMALQSLATERLVFAGDDLVYERRVAGLRWRRRRMSRKGLAVRVQTAGSSRGVIVAGSGQRWIVGRRLNTAGQEGLRKWLTGPMPLPPEEVQ